MSQASSKVFRIVRSLSSAKYRPITIELYREHQNADPVLPRAYTMDIETLTLPDFRERIGPQLEKLLKLGNMRLEQQQRYLEDIAIEEERCYQLGSLSATSGRVVSIAVQEGPVAGFDFGVEQRARKLCLVLLKPGKSRTRKIAAGILEFMKDFDCETDEIARPQPPRV